MKWFERIILVIIFILIGMHIGSQWTLHELGPVIEQSMQIIRGDHRTLLMGDYESLKGIYEGKNVKKKDGRMAGKKISPRLSPRQDKGTVPEKRSGN